VSPKVTDPKINKDLHNNMRKYIRVLIITIAGVALALVFKSTYCPLRRPGVDKGNAMSSIDLKVCQENLLKYLKLRKDELAAKEIDKILSAGPMTSAHYGAGRRFFAGIINLKKQKNY
jgi:hypothetical protein